MKEIIKQTIDDFARDGVPTGSFLYAVLTNNLIGAFGKADEDNRRDLFEICDYVYNKIPLTCWGSPEKVKAWIEKKREERKKGEKE